MAAIPVGFSLYYRIRRLIWGLPGIYLPLLHLRNVLRGTDIPKTGLDRKLHSETRAIVNRKSDLVVEAFQRSGNTFAEIAFRFAQQQPVRLAHHLHTPSQILRASSLGVPALVIVRSPVDAVVSAKLRIPGVSLQSLLLDYASFYEKILRVRDSVQIATFEQIVGDYGGVIDMLNTRFGTKFNTFNHTHENVSKVLSEIEKRNSTLFGNGKVVESMVARPSQVRESQRQKIIDSIMSQECNVALTRAMKIFEVYSS